MFDGRERREMEHNSVRFFSVVAVAANLCLLQPALAGDLIFKDGFEHSCEVDSDGDRLVDCLEVLVYGTDPDNPDTDGDGLSDGDETLGTLDGLDLPSMGVNPRRKDILIEYDWIDDCVECGCHSHRPTQLVLDLVTAMFANSPVQNPDGSTGVNVIHDYGQGGAFTGGNQIVGGATLIEGTTYGPEFQAYKAANFAPNRQGYFHYAIMGHRYRPSPSDPTNSSGWGDLPGDDFMVTLWCFHWNTDYVARTIAHELGHNLNLYHGGSNNCNYKPNYNSLMNYRYQFSGVDFDCDVVGDGVMDYSYGDRIVLNENNLNEFVGVCGDLGSATVPVDWNVSGTIEASVVHDVNVQAGPSNQNTACGGTLTTLQDFNDWANILLNVLPPDGGGSQPPDQEACPAPPEL